MPEPIQHKLIDPRIHLLVLLDQAAREARYVTTYDDGTTDETTHMLYWYTKASGGEVRSCPIEEWPIIQPLPQVSASAPAASLADLVGQDATGWGLAAEGLLSALGAIGRDGRVLPLA